MPGNSFGWVGKTDVIGRVAGTVGTVAAGAPIWAPLGFWVWTGGVAGGEHNTLNDAAPNRVAMHAANGYIAYFKRILRADCLLAPPLSFWGFNGSGKIGSNSKRLICVARSY